MKVCALWLKVIVRVVAVEPSFHDVRSKRETELDETEAGIATCMVAPDALLTAQGVAHAFPSTENCMPAGTLVTVTCGSAAKFAVSTKLVVVVGMVNVCIAAPPLDQLTKDQVRPCA